MKKILQFVKKEPVLCAGSLLAIVSAFWVKPSIEYIKYIDFRVLALLFCLMAVVAGLKELGAFRVAAKELGKRVRTVRQFTILMSLVCFFAAMFITNDVALITFVPLTLLMMKGQKESDTIKAVVAETVAVNLGSMLTPIGNPQNLYLFSHSGYSVPQFVWGMLPVTGVSFVMVIVFALCCSGEHLSLPGEENEKVKLSWFKIISYLLLFGVCLLNVFHILEYPLMLLVVLVAVLIIDRRVLLKVDYLLLLTFVSFFIFIGNLGAIPVVRETIEKAIQGRELLVGILSSQIFSNVPAAMLLSTFTTNTMHLLWGVNIGGLGTLIASMASLISYKFYAAEKTAKKGKYLLIFTIVNVAMLFVLLAFALCYNPKEITAEGQPEVAAVTDVVGDEENVGTAGQAEQEEEVGAQESVEQAGEMKSGEASEGKTDEVKAGDASEGKTDGAKAGAASEGKTDEMKSGDASEGKTDGAKSGDTEEAKIDKAMSKDADEAKKFGSEYGVFISCDSTESSKFANYHTIVIDAEFFTVEEIRALKNAGHRVISYINVGSVENFRSYYAQYEGITLSAYENWEEERWVDVSKNEWQDFIVNNVAQGHLDKEIDGFFVDNCDVYYMYPTEEIYNGLVNIMGQLVQTGKEVIINGGDTFVTTYLARNSQVSGIMTGANQETVFSSIDFDSETFGRQPAEEYEYFREYVETVGESGVDVYLLEYTTDAAVIDDIRSYCAEKGFMYYISNSIELDGD